jgi:hypothetical protein
MLLTFCLRQDYSDQPMNFKSWASSGFRSQGHCPSKSQDFACNSAPRQIVITLAQSWCNRIVPTILSSQWRSSGLTICDKIHFTTIVQRERRDLNAKLLQKSPLYLGCITNYGVSYCEDNLINWDIKRASSKDGFILDEEHLVLGCIV